MADVTAGPFLVAVALLGVAGLAKLARPSATAKALRAAGLPGSDLVGRLVGLFEVVVALCALVAGSRATALAVACCYVAFAAFTARAIAREGTAADCGCFGEAAAPATRTHVALDLGFAVLAALAVVAPPGPVGAVLGDQPLMGIPFLALVAVGTWLGHVAYTRLGALEAAVAEGRSDGGAGSGGAR